MEPQRSEQDLRDARIRKLELESRKLEREIRRMDCPFWQQPAFWRSLLAAAAVSAASYAAITRAL